MSYRLEKIDNGATILLVPQPTALSVSVMVVVNAGSKNESEENSGISHFLEHMGFKGTKNRPTSFALSSELDALGAGYNAFTGHDATAYYVTTIPEKAEQAIDILADMYINSTLPEEEIAKERGVIIEEIKMYEDEPRSLVWDVFAKNTYTGSAAGRLTIGERETVSAITRDDLCQYRSRHYSALATTIVVVGCFVEEKIKSLIVEKFASLPKGETASFEKLKLIADGPKVCLAERPIDQSHFVLGFKTVDLADDQLPQLTLLSRILGGGMSSRLFQRVREDLGAAYYVGAGQNAHLDHGFLAIYAGVDAKRLSEVVEVISEEIVKLKQEPIDLEELNRAKDCLVGNLFLHLETPSEQTYFYGEQSLIGKEILSPQQYADKIRSITAEELKVIANEIFCLDRLSLAIVGPACSIDEIRSKLKV